ncbi:MAG TPA: type 4a pilus biogenesis protein PilO [Polyangia bacterium]|jgi:type IV pilus assembly protein PilO
MNETLRKLLKLKTPAKIGVTAATILVVGLLFYQLLYSDVADDIKKAKAQQSELRDEKTSYDKRKGEYLSYRTELTQLQDEQRELLKALPKKAEIPSFISNIQEQAELAGLEVLNIDIAAEVAQELYVKIPVRMEIRGTYHQVAKFFKNTSELRRIVNVENLTLTPERGTAGEQQNAPTRMRAKFVAATFRFKEAPDEPEAGK